MFPFSAIWRYWSRRHCSRFIDTNNSKTVSLVSSNSEMYLFYRLSERNRLSSQTQRIIQSCGNGFDLMLYLFWKFAKLDSSFKFVVRAEKKQRMINGFLKSEFPFCLIVFIENMLEFDEIQLCQSTFDILANNTPLISHVIYFWHVTIETTNGIR